MTAAFFDLDRTLLDVNSGQLWLVHEWKTGHVRTWDAAVGAYWLARYALGESSLDHALDRACSVYAGVSEAELRGRIEAWFDQDVASRVRPGALVELERHRREGATLVLATSASQFVAERARALWGFDDVVCTQVEVEQGRVTGRVAAYAIGTHKLTACAAWAGAHGHALADCAFYTDSYSDLSLLEAVGRPVVVHPDRRLARAAAERGWSVVDWGTASA